MTTQPGDASMVSPPSWALGLLSLLLPPQEAETVSGDLVEEYREVIYPAAGSWRANLWFVRQAIGFVWQGPMAWGLLVAAFISGRFALDTFMPPASYSARAFFTTWSSVALYLAAGVWGARRTGRARTGTIMAFTAHVIGWGVNELIVIVLFVGVIRNQPGVLNLFEETGGWGEQWFLPLMILPIVLMLGWLGGVAGRSRTSRVRA